MVTEKQKLNFIDALRGLAILGVIMVHVDQYGSSVLPNTIGKIVSEGARGVQLFFLASAFTLFLSLKSRNKIEHFPIRNFFIRRFFRIAPMYYLGVIYYLLQDGFGNRYWLGDQEYITNFNILSNFTFTHGFYPYFITSIVPGGWSIGVEMTFYAILPLLFFKIKSLNQSFALFIFSLILKFIFQQLFNQFQLISDIRLWNEYLFLYFPSQFPVFCLGIILYFIIIEKDKISNISPNYILIFSLLLILQYASGIQFLPHHIFFSISFFLLAFALNFSPIILFVNPVITYIGKISFSMYLVHFACLHWLTYFNFIDYFYNPIINYITRFSLVSILTILLASIFYKFIEMPFQLVGKIIINSIEK